MLKKFSQLRWIAALALAITPCVASAETFNLSSLTLADFDKIIKEFSSNFSYTTVTPASSLGGLGGFEFGVVGGKTDAPELLRLVKQANSSASFKGDLYHGGVVGRVGLPYGLTAEALFFPKKKFKDASFQEFGGAVMWTATDSVLEGLPLNLAVKGHLLKTKVTYSQTVTYTVPVAGAASGTGTVKFDDTLMGIQALASKQFFFLEPYVGLGYIKSKGVLAVDAAGATTLLAFTSNNRAESKPTSVQLMAGVDARFLFLSVGAEYQKAFGTSSMTGRLSFRF